MVSRSGGNLQECLLPQRAIVGVSILVMCQLLLLLPHLTHSIIPPGFKKTDCGERCEKLRPQGLKESFKFNCSDVYTTNFTVKECIQDCDNCPKEVCDETISNHSADSWHCPETKLERECRDYCTKRRLQGKRESYSFTCSQTSSFCNADCIHPCNEFEFVCDDVDASKYHCPYETFEGDCRVECDKVRATISPSTQDIKYMDYFPFECDVQYASDNNAKDLCEKTGRDICPMWVSELKNAPARVKYHCPAGQVPDGECKALCDEYRDQSSDAAYVLKCTDKHDKTFCENACNACVTPNSPNFVCEKNNPEYFLCPPREPDNPEPKGVPSYKGQCKNRCEKSQGGGFRPFKLDCERRYKTMEEITKCKDDCMTCPHDCNYGNIIKCRGIKKKLEEEAEQKRKEEEAHQKLLEHQYNEHVDRMRNINIAFWILVGVLLSVSFGFLIYFEKKYRHPAVVMVATLVTPQSQQFRAAPQTPQQPATLPASQTESLAQPPSADGQI